MADVWCEWERGWFKPSQIGPGFGELREHLNVETRHTLNGMAITGPGPNASIVRGDDEGIYGRGPMAESDDRHE